MTRRLLVYVAAKLLQGLAGLAALLLLAIFAGLAVRLFLIAAGL